MTEPSPQPSRAAGGRGAQVLSFIAGVLVVLAAVWIIQKVRQPKSAAPVPDQSAQTQTFPIPSEPPPGANEESAELKAYPRISVADAQSELSSGKASLIDVRDAEDYLELHAAGAMHIPVRYIEGEAQYLPKDKTIVLYCTCPAEEAAIAAGQKLNAAGLSKVVALKGGLDAWREAGLPTEKGDPRAKAGQPQ